MKRTIIIIATLLLGGLAAFAQSTAEEYSEKYNRLVSRLGYAGVGIETYIDKWEAAFPEDGKMLEARCNYYLAKGMTTEVVPMSAEKYLGNKPVISLPDSTGKKTNYFEVVNYDDELFGQAISCLDKAITLYPLDLVYRTDLISCLLAYEKDSPDMALKELDKLVNKEKKEHPEWVVYGEKAEEGVFSDLVSNFCVRLYNIGAPSAYEAFFALSTKLSKLYPKNSNYVDNIGSYWLVAKGNERKAMRFYKKALKLNPDDEVAKTNIRVIERRKNAATKKKN